jgi:TPP-dependent pyruvate/acetoin dehydrogenase alpha subunit
MSTDRQTEDQRRGAASSLISADPGRARTMLRTMLLIRRFDELALKLMWSGRIHGVVHPYIGEEACAVGVCSALAEGDHIMSNHRGHGHSIAAGIAVERMMAELFGRATGCCQGRGGSMHMADFSVGMLGANGIVGAGVPIAAGAALSDALDGRDNISVVFFGDGATGQGIVYETINIAALWKLPMLFVCENNGYASETPFSSTLPVKRVADVAAGHGLPAETIDGHDVLAVREAVTHALARVRAGEGPLFVECLLDRWAVHSSRTVRTADSRDASILLGYRERDPIRLLASQLEQAGALGKASLDVLEADVDRELQDAVAFAEASPWPDVSGVMEGVFA